MGNDYNGLPDNQVPDNLADADSTERATVTAVISVFAYFMLSYKFHGRMLVQ